MQAPISPWWEAAKTWGPAVAALGFIGWFSAMKGWPWLTAFIEKRDSWAMTQVETAQARLATSQDRLHEVATECIAQMREQSKSFASIRDALTQVIAHAEQQQRMLTVLSDHVAQLRERAR